MKTLKNRSTRASGPLHTHHVATFLLAVFLITGCSSTEKVSDELQRYCEIGKSTLPMGARPALNDAEIWAEWETTTPSDMAKTTIQDFLRGVLQLQTERGPEHVSAEDLVKLMDSVVTANGLVSPDCGPFLRDRAIRWADEQRIVDIIDFCRMYRLKSNNTGHLSITATADSHDLFLREVVADWESKRLQHSKTQAFINAIVALPPEVRGKTFATDLRSFFGVRERETVVCRELQEHVEALYKQANGKPAHE